MGTDKKGEVKGFGVQGKKRSSRRDAEAQRKIDHG
jgi:hypothetical protein